MARPGVSCKALTLVYDDDDDDDDEDDDDEDCALVLPSLTYMSWSAVTRTEIWDALADVADAVAAAVVEEKEFSSHLARVALWTNSTYRSGVSAITGSPSM